MNYCLWHGEEYSEECLGCLYDIQEQSFEDVLKDLQAIADKQLTQAIALSSRSN